MTTIQSRVSQDRRNTSRIIARLDCGFTYAGVRYEAVLVDLSFRGAYVSSEFLPPNGSTIMVTLAPPAVKDELVFQATIIRGTWAMSEHGKRGRFGIRFSGASPELMLLISKMNS
jgi:hypothetical protein